MVLTLSLALIVAIALVHAGDLHGKLSLGGFGPQKNATKEVQSLIDQVPPTECRLKPQTHGLCMCMWREGEPCAIQPDILTKNVYSINIITTWCYCSGGSQLSQRLEYRSCEGFNLAQI